MQCFSVLWCFVDSPPPFQIPGSAPESQFGSSLLSQGLPGMGTQNCSYFVRCIVHFVRRCVDGIVRRGTVVSQRYKPERALTFFPFNRRQAVFSCNTINQIYQLTPKTNTVPFCVNIQIAVSHQIDTNKPLSFKSVINCTRS